MKYLWILSLFFMLAYSNETQTLNNMEEKLLSLSNAYDKAEKSCKKDSTLFNKECTEVLSLGQKIVLQTAVYHKLKSKLNLQTEQNISVVQREKNILESIRDRCLFASDMEACTLMNKNIYRTMNITKVYKMLGEKEKCHKGDLKACNIYAMDLLKHKNFKGAMQYSEKACSQKSYEACTTLGLSYANLKKVDKALFYLNLACEHKIGKACYMAGKYYENVTKDARKAASLYLLGCNNFSLDACQESNTVPTEVNNSEALNRGLKAYKERQTLADEKLEKIYKLCVKKDNEACKKYVKLSSQTSKDKAPVWRDKVYKLQCDRGNLDACWEYARSIPYEQTTKIMSIYKKACEKGHARSCLYLAGEYKGSKFKEKIIPAYQHACEKGSSSACYELGNYLYKHHDKKQAKEYYQKSCMQNHWQGCKRFVDLVRK